MLYPNETNSELFTLIIFVQWGRVSGYPRSRFSSLFLPRYFILLQLLFSVIFSHIIFCFWFCCCLLFYFWLCFFILEPLRYFSVLFSHIFLVFSWFWFHFAIFSWFWFHFATINFLSWFFYWSHHLIIVFDFAFICSHIYFIVVLFSSVFLVSLFFQAVFMISFFAVIFFTCCNFVHCSLCILFFWIFICLSFIGFINKQYFIRQVISLD